jgi:hypothetical protein
MKKIFSLMFALTLCAQALGYTVSNDLGSPFILSYWTNNGTSYTFSLVSNVAPTALYVPVISTNGNAGLALTPTNGTVTMFSTWTNMAYQSNVVSSMFTNALASLAPPLETVPQLQTILKSYFITGAVPTEANYWELIDTLFWYANYSYQAQLSILALLNNQPLVVNARPGYQIVTDAGVSQTNYFNVTILFSGDNPPYTNIITATNWNSGVAGSSPPYYYITNMFVTTSNSYTIPVTLYGAPTIGGASNLVQFNVVATGANGQQAAFTLPCSLEAVY